VISGTLNPALLRWAGLTAVALAELTWLAIRIEVPSTGFLSIFKNFPSIFVTSLSVVTVLVWASSRGKLLEIPVFQDFPQNPWRMVLAHWGAFALFFWLLLFYRFQLKDEIGKISKSPPQPLPSPPTHPPTDLCQFSLTTICRFLLKDKIGKKAVIPHPSACPLPFFSQWKQKKRCPASGDGPSAVIIIRFKGTFQLQDGLWRFNRNNRGRRIRGPSAPVGAQIQAGHLEQLLPVLKAEGLPNAPITLAKTSGPKKVTVTSEKSRAFLSNPGCLFFN
jgi:hypothetical protein